MSSRPKEYNKKFKQYREQIWLFKEQGLTPMAILLYYRGIGIELNYKSIQSVKNPFMNTPYRQFKILAVRYLIDSLQSLTNLDSMIGEFEEIGARKSKLRKWITSQITKLCGPHSHLRDKLPQDRINDEMRRIRKQIRGDVEQKIVAPQTSQIQQSVQTINDASEEIDFEESVIVSQQEEQQHLYLYQESPLVLKYGENPTYCGEYQEEYPGSNDIYLCL